MAISVIIEGSSNPISASRRKSDGSDRTDEILFIRAKGGAEPISYGRLIQQLPVNFRQDQHQSQGKQHQQASKQARREIVNINNILYT
jgi:hypothetical protein